MSSAHTHTAHFQAIIPAPFGALGVVCDEQSIREIRFLPPGTDARAATSALAERASSQLQAWLDAPHNRFDLPLRPAGTAFQRRVWAAICNIPTGDVQTYGHIARELASAAQAVGQACGANPFPIVVPCHRVVARHALGGFAGHRDGFLIKTKQWLLQHEVMRTGN